MRTLQSYNNCLTKGTCCGGAFQWSCARSALECHKVRYRERAIQAKIFRVACCIQHLLTNPVQSILNSPNENLDTDCFKSLDLWMDENMTNWDAALDAENLIRKRVTVAEAFKAKRMFEKRFLRNSTYNGVFASYVQQTAVSNDTGSLWRGPWAMKTSVKCPEDALQPCMHNDISRQEKRKRRVLSPHLFDLNALHKTPYKTQKLGAAFFTPQNEKAARNLERASKLSGEEIQQEVINKKNFKSCSRGNRQNDDRKIPQHNENLHSISQADGGTIRKKRRRTGVPPHGVDAVTPRNSAGRTDSITVKSDDRIKVSELPKFLWSSVTCFRTACIIYINLSRILKDHTFMHSGAQQPSFVNSSTTAEEENNALLLSKALMRPNRKFWFSEQTKKLNYMFSKNSILLELEKQFKFYIKRYTRSNSPRFFSLRGKRIKRKEGFGYFFHPHVITTLCKRQLDNGFLIYSIRYTIKKFNQDKHNTTGLKEQLMCEEATEAQTAAAVFSNHCAIDQKKINSHIEETEKNNLKYSTASPFTIKNICEKKLYNNKSGLCAFLSNNTKKKSLGFIDIVVQQTLVCKERNVPKHNKAIMKQSQRKGIVAEPHHNDRGHDGVKHEMINTEDSEISLLSSNINHFLYSQDAKINKDFTPTNVLSKVNDDTLNRIYFMMLASQLGKRDDSRYEGLINNVESKKEKRERREDRNETVSFPFDDKGDKSKNDKEIEILGNCSVNHGTLSEEEYQRKAQMTSTADSDSAVCWHITDIIVNIPSTTLSDVSSDSDYKNILTYFILQGVTKIIRDASRIKSVIAVCALTPTVPYTVSTHENQLCSHFINLGDTLATCGFIPTSWSIVTRLGMTCFMDPQTTSSTPGSTQHQEKSKHRARNLIQLQPLIHMQSFKGPVSLREFCVGSLVKARINKCRELGLVTSVYHDLEHWGSESQYSVARLTLGNSKNQTTETKVPFGSITSCPLERSVLKKNSLRLLPKRQYADALRQSLGLLHQSCLCFPLTHQSLTAFYDDEKNQKSEKQLEREETLVQITDDNVDKHNVLLPPSSQPVSHKSYNGKSHKKISRQSLNSTTKQVKESKEVSQQEESTLEQKIYSKQQEQPVTSKLPTRLCKKTQPLFDKCHGSPFFRFSKVHVNRVEELKSKPFFQKLKGQIVDLVSSQFPNESDNNIQHNLCRSTWIYYITYSMKNNLQYQNLEFNPLCSVAIIQDLHILRPTPQLNHHRVKQTAQQSNPDAKKHLPPTLQNNCHRVATQEYQKLGYVWYIATHDSFKRRGFGTKLCKSITKNLKSYGYAGILLLSSLWDWNEEPEADNNNVVPKKLLCLKKTSSGGSMESYVSKNGKLSKRKLLALNKSPSNHDGLAKECAKRDFRRPNSADCFWKVFHFAHIHLRTFQYAINSSSMSQNLKCPKDAVPMYLPLTKEGYWLLPKKTLQDSVAPSKRTSRRRCIS